ncbi:hypothetical protein V8G54_023246 [Vigna mungo]|uniref:Uncharacterized protein n=1 Tax=Vigna mungo TaxID=3915 RepID=A0AAQ3N4T6_VIGMU
MLLDLVSLSLSPPPIHPSSSLSQWILVSTPGGALGGLPEHCTCKLLLPLLFLKIQNLHSSTCRGALHVHGEAMGEHNCKIFILISACDSFRLATIILCKQYISLTSVWPSFTLHFLWFTPLQTPNALSFTHLPNQLLFYV